MKSPYVSSFFITYKPLKWLAYDDPKWDSMVRTHQMYWWITDETIVTTGSATNAVARREDDKK
jgi:hypothetical protein